MSGVQPNVDPNPVESASLRIASIARAASRCMVSVTCEVHVEGEGDARVPEHLGRDLRMDAATEQERGCRVALNG